MAYNSPFRYKQVLRTLFYPGYMNPRRICRLKSSSISPSARRSRPLHARGVLVFGEPTARLLHPLLTPQNSPPRRVPMV